VDFVECVRELAGGYSMVRPLVEPLLSILATMLRELACLTKRVLDIVEICRRLILWLDSLPPWLL